MAVEGDVKAETESEIVAAQDQVLHKNIVQQKYCTQKQTANVDYVNNLMRQLNT